MDEDGHKWFGGDSWRLFERSNLVQHAGTDNVGRTCQCDVSKVSRDLLQTFIFILGLSWIPRASEFVTKAFCQSEDR